jgi:hypothetical protein
LEDCLKNLFASQEEHALKIVDKIFNEKVASSTPYIWFELTQWANEAFMSN